MTGAAIVRIPATPAQLLTLCTLYRELAALAHSHGRPWPASLDEWADVLDAWREPVT